MDSEVKREIMLVATKDTEDTKDNAGPILGNSQSELGKIQSDPLRPWCPSW
jgi:hypothetical protein